MDLMSMIQGLVAKLNELADSVSQLQADGAAKDAKIADLEKGIPADTTPYSQDDMDKVTKHADDVQAELDKVSSDDAADKAAVKAAGDKLEALKAAILEIVQPAPAPAPAPVEQPEQPVADQPASV